MLEDAETAGPRGPGYRLREVRESRGLKIADVARTLRLDAKVIIALEADDYAALPAPIFIKGYLKQYCKLLTLPADECIAEYERGIGGVAPPPLVVRRAAGDEIAPSSSPITLVSWLVGVVAIGMVVLWWVARPEQAPQPALVATAEPEVHAETIEPTMTMTPAPVTAPTPVQPARGNASVAAAADVAPELTHARFEFREESWAEVVGADGRRLFFDLARAGAVIEVEGVAPISVFLGNAPSVRIMVDGQRFDQSRYLRSGNVARFSVGTPMQEPR